MATYWRGELLAGGIKLGEKTAIYRRVPIEVATDEAQTITLQKAGTTGTTFGASSATATKVSAKIYEIQLLEADVNTRGILYIRAAGATNTQEGFVVIDPKQRTDADNRYRAAT